MRISQMKSKVQATPINVTSIADIEAAILSYDFSPCTYKNSYRNDNNFEQTELLVLDYDSSPQMTILSAIQTFAPFKHIIATTRNHGIKPGDRFRVILFLSSPIVDAAMLRRTLLDAMGKFPGADAKCKDPARYFYKHKEVRSHREEGELITPSAPVAVRAPDEEKGRLAVRTIRFLSEGAPEGEWNHALFCAAKDYQQQLYTEDEFLIEAEKVTGHLDASDKRTIKSAFASPSRYGARSEQAPMAAVEVWVRDWLEENAVTRIYKTGALVVKGMEQAADRVLNNIILDAVLWAERNPIMSARGTPSPRTPYSEKLIERVLSKWIDEQDSEAFSYNIAGLAHDPACAQGEIQKWLLAVTGEASSEINQAVVQHFIWQVKRKIANMPVEHHLMPVLVGHTGGGKTEAVKRLLSPVMELTQAGMSMSGLDDTREAFMLGKYPVVFYDELSKVERVDVSSLKNRITTDWLTYRKLGTNISITCRNIATFIGCSNDPIRSIIKDTTSARRFWQVDCLKKLDFALVNSVNASEIWRSVNEKSACPILPFLDDIQTIQWTELRAKSYVEQWAEDAMEPSETFLPMYETIRLFVEWCDEAGLKNYGMTPDAMGLHLTRMGYERKRARLGSEYKIKLKKESDNFFALKKV